MIPAIEADDATATASDNPTTRRNVPHGLRTDGVACRGGASGGVIGVALVTVLPDVLGGGRGIRTHETLLPTGFQDQLHRPLGQPSVFKSNRVNRVS